MQKRLVNKVTIEKRLAEGAYLQISLLIKKEELPMILRMTMIDQLLGGANTDFKISITPIDRYERASFTDDLFLILRPRR